MGPLGWQETIFIFILALLIFGPKKLPELGKTIGKAMTEFRRASSELKSTWDREMAAIQRERDSLNETSRSIQNEINSSVGGTDYDYGYNYGESYDSPHNDSGSYGTESTNSEGENPSTASASALQGAEDTPAESGSGTASGQAASEAPVAEAAPGESENGTSGSEVVRT